MILIYSAAEVQKRILDDAPSFFGKHLTYFKDKYPTFFKHEATETTADIEGQMLETAHQKMIDRI